MTAKVAGELRRDPVNLIDLLGAVTDHEERHEDLQHNTRRMLQALDAYWLGYEGLPKGRYPRGRYESEDWWNRFEKYREKVEAAL